MLKRKHEYDDGSVGRVVESAYKKYRTVSDKIGILSLQDEHNHRHQADDNIIQLDSTSYEDSPMLLEQTDTSTNNNNIVQNNNIVNIINNNVNNNNNTINNYNTNKNQSLAIVPIVDYINDARHMDRSDLVKKKAQGCAAGGYQLATESLGQVMDIHSILYTPSPCNDLPLPFFNTNMHERSLILYTEPSHIINESIRRHVVGDEKKQFNSRPRVEELDEQDDDAMDITG
ncbi:hypothetical protein SAMD00019534_003620, partial [Acytostelium subglobosum LB1]|uniref:hypothetical protein n=1 Tax=Acytostelium subglobosum LB1 TaxID=1410327 RepID=UPI000644CEDA